MHQTRKIQDDIYWVGGNDRRLAVFEGVFSIPRGVSYNAYLVLDEQTVLLDTVDRAASGLFLENLEYLLAGRPLDYVIVNHMEPDHCAVLPELALRYPKLKIIGNDLSFTMMKQFFDFDVDARALVVREGDNFTSGRHNFSFLMAPMVHWPEVMVSYDAASKILFSADAFGSFGALNGNLFADEVDFERDWLPDARRYYANIVGKYGDQVRALLEKTAKLDIAMICPLHGLVWRKNIGWYIEKYRRWASWMPEDENSVMIAYASIYGDTANAADILAGALAERGVRNIVTYDVSVIDSSFVVAEAFRCSHLVFASTTYNAGIFIKMEEAILDLQKHALKHRTVALIENGSWAPASGGLMRDLFNTMDDIRITGDTITLHSALKEDQLADINRLADKLVETMPKTAVPRHDFRVQPLDPGAFFKFSYGLFLLTSREGAKDNGCIINTGLQLTDNPKLISMAVNRANFSRDLIARTGVFNLSMLTVDVPFKVFQDYGFRSGRDLDKFAGVPGLVRSENGVYYLPEYSNAFISGKLVSATDYATHTLFIAEVTEAGLLSNLPSLSYQYYFDHIKPRNPPVQAKEKKEGWVCKICGYVHEGPDLPGDFVCPLCKHGAESFERLI
ncbi:MAG: flavin reductase [Treponema sp.]|jgi:flavorubredoxin/flavin reductase (DIM6/NTAB) family NADH-FMN oxidoreductase RutF/rubredoxin|nr:flavin reductase [Treponema sp.]